MEKRTGILKKKLGVNCASIIPETERQCRVKVKLNDLLDESV
jgi:hypothetical protein